MAESIPKGGTGKYVRQGHTRGKYGNDPGTGSANRNPSEIKPQG